MGLFKSFKDAMSRKNEELDQGPYVGDGKHLQQPPTADSDSKHQLSRSYQDVNDTSHTHKSDPYQPPPGPPPIHQDQDLNLPPYESWLSVPDNSQLPPPPTLSNEYSTANNASFDSAKAGHKWCAKNPVYTPSIPRTSTILEASQAGHLSFDPPPRAFKGKLTQLDPRTYHIKTDKSQQDTILTSTIPIYLAAVSNPLLNATSPSPITFAFSVKLTTLHKSAGLAIGFTSKPYPPFRLPGWHRASLAVHSDDGNRYTNDPYGGMDFVSPFAPNDHVRLTVTVYPRPSPVQVYRGNVSDVRPVAGGLPKCVVRVEFERNGIGEGGWDVCEERDAERDEGVEGLQGEADLYCAVGVFGMVEAEARFEGVGLG